MKPIKFKTMNIHIKTLFIMLIMAIMFFVILAIICYSKALFLGIVVFLIIYFFVYTGLLPRTK